MRILVLGATGRTGRHVVEQALLHGHDVSCLVRPSSPVTGPFAVILGDSTDPHLLAKVIPEHDVVISCLGQRGQADERLLQLSAQAAADAMRKTVGRPIFFVSQGLLFPSRNPLIFILRVILARHLRDSRTMEGIVRATTIDWMIVRPPRLLDGGRGEGYRVSVDLRPNGPASMQRSDLATFLLDEADARRYLQKVVGLTSAR